MHLLTTLLSLLLSSSLEAAQSKRTESSVPVSSSAFVSDKNLTTVYDSKAVDNMPAVQSQDTVGSCFGCAASTIVQKYICDKDRYFIDNKIECKDAPSERTVSQLSMVAWADTNENRQPGNPLGQNQTPGEPDNHRNIKLDSDRTDFSSGANALENSIKTFKFMPESCFPMDQLVKEFGTKGNKSNQLFDTIYEKTRNLYLSEVKKIAEGGSICEKCLLDQLNKDFNSNFAKDALLSALTKESYGKFLFELIFHNCKPMSIPLRPKYNQLPNEDKKNLPRSEIFKTLRDLTSLNRPVQVNSVCLKYDASKKECESFHTTVVSGTRLACPAGAPKNSTQCKLQVQIHNCWGNDWQDDKSEHPGGWVDAANFIERIDQGAASLKKGELSWLE